MKEIFRFNFCDLLFTYIMIENVERNKQVSSRLRDVANYLIKIGKAVNDKDLATKINTNVTTFSLVMNGRTKATDNFIMKLCGICENLNQDWIYTGNGTMLRGENESTEDFIAPKTTENLAMALQTIDKLVNQMAEKDRQIGRLIDIISQEKNNTAAPEVASSAAASE